MARQGGRAQLEQSDMHLDLNMAKMAKVGFLHATLEEMQYLIKIPCAEVKEETKQGVQLSEHSKQKAGTEIHPSMVRDNQMDSCLAGRNGAPKNMPTRWRCEGTGAPPPEPASPPPRMPPAPPSDNEGDHSSQIEGLPHRYRYIHTRIPSTECFNLDAYAKDRKRDTDFIPDLLTAEGTSTG